MKQSKTPIHIIVQVFLCHCFLLQGLSLRSQDSHFSQFDLAPLLLNPALTGVMKGNHRLIAKYRAQWNSIVREDYFHHYYASYDARFCVEDNFVALGFLAQTDQVGDARLKNSRLMGSAAYHQRLRDDLYLSSGVTAGFMNYSFDLAALRFDAQFDGAGYNATLPHFEDFIADSRFVFDLNLGLSLYHVKEGWMAGFTINHLNQPAYSFTTEDENWLGIGYTFHGSYSIPLGLNQNFSSIILKALYQRQSIQNNGNQWHSLIGARIKYQYSNTWDLYLGTYVRISGHSIGNPLTIDAMILEILLENEQISFGLSYDINLSTIAQASSFRGGLEITVSYRISNEIDCVRCPRF